EALPRNLSGARVDTALRGGRIQLPGVAAAAGAAAFRADLAFNRPLDDQAIAGCRPVPRGRSRIVEIGDGSQLTASRELDADGLLIAPALAARVEGWRQHRWLDATALDRLTGQGIARIVWEVAPRRRTAATARARELAAPGRAHLEVR